LNEKADQLAKEGCNSGWDIKSCFNYSIKHFHFFPQFSNTPIEHRFRKFVSSLFQTKSCAEWSLLHSIEERLTNHSIWWKSSWAFLKNITGFKCNQGRKHLLWAYGIKAFHRLLPLGKILCQRHSSLYHDMGCAVCENQNCIEDWDHFITCKAMINQRNAMFKHLRQDFGDFLTKWLKNRNQDKDDAANIHSNVDKVLLALLGSDALSLNLLQMGGRSQDKRRRYYDFKKDS